MKHAIKRHKLGHKLETVSTLRIKQWGTWAFARHCQKLGVSFEDAYWMVCGRYPTR
jgi:hypothetical protein